jgi:anti-anti-sigma factor
MTITAECHLILFRPEGRIDLQSGMALSEKMAKVIPNPNQLWVIDLAKVDFMDSSGLVPLVKGLTVARQSGCRLVICNVQAPVRLILEITQLDSVIAIFNTYEEILSSLTNQTLTISE